MEELHVLNGRFVIPETGVVSGTLIVRDGRVAEIVQGEPRSTPDREIDAQGRYVLPGLIDPHTHSGLLPPLSARLEAESAFGASGGITTVIRYFRRTDSYLETVPGQVEVGVKTHYQDFTHHLALFTEQQVDQLDACVRKFGITSYKLYMNLKGPFGKGFLMDITPEREDEVDRADVNFDDGHMYEAFRRAARVPAPIRMAVHCEDAEIVLHETSRIRELGLEGLAAWHAARPGNSEALGIQMVAYLSRKFGVPVYYPHIGSREAVDAMAEVRSAGTNYYAETCPQYIALSTESEAGVLAKVMPPVRTSDDAVKVWWGIQNNVLECLGSDHIPYTLDEKQPGPVWETRPAFGGTGMILPVFLSEGVNKGKLTIRRLVELASFNTAKAFGLYPTKGTLLPGADADFVIIDLEREWTVHASESLSSSDFSVYEDQTMRGDVVLTAVRGEVIYEEGKIMGPRGHGRFLRRYPRIEATTSVS